jgi:hypothetical protein
MATTTNTQAGATTGSKPQAPVSSTERCCRCGCAPPVCTCCELVCFERPDYHCGHLLTDADLSLQVRYVVEKNKLRNRTLHGHGVVCGLKLTCDPLCCDNILLHEGYAIDDCGNDIVVCETTRFDVIAALKAKHLLVKAEEQERCEPKHEERECRIPQCFYVTICYEEEDAEFQTPFQAGCTSGPQDCVPTRIKERFRLEVTDERPHAHSYLDRLEKKLRHCYRLFLDSPVGRLIKQRLPLLKAVAGGKIQPPPGKTDENCEVFCLLKAQFQQQLKACPDELSCRLAKEVACLHCPDEKGDNYAPAMAEAFARLFELMHQYQYDCVLADLVFGCEAPEEACCVPLGSVQVEDGCLIRVNNNPRSYVWSFANILQILTSEVLTAATEAKEAASEGGEPGQEPTRDCCAPVVKFDHLTFLDEFEVDGSARYLAASAPLRAMRAVHTAFAENFAFTDSKAFAPALFALADAKDSVRLVEALGLSISSPDQSVELATLNPMQAMMSQALMRRSDSLRAYPGTEGAIRAVLPDYEAEVSPERPASIPETLQSALAERDKTITALTSRLDQLQQRVEAIAQHAGTPPSGPGTPGAPSGPA